MAEITCKCAHYCTLSEDLRESITEFILTQHRGSVEHGPLHIEGTLEGLLRWAQEGRQESVDQQAYFTFAIREIQKMIGGRACGESRSERTYVPGLQPGEQIPV
jgi:hypothetical protein